MTKKPLKIAIIADALDYQYAGIYYYTKEIIKALAAVDSFNEYFIVRAISEGNLVALRTYQNWPDNEEYVTMDYFRFDDNGKIVEHWDVVDSMGYEKSQE